MGDQRPIGDQPADHRVPDAEVAARVRRAQRFLVAAPPKSSRPFSVHCHAGGGSPVLGTLQAGHALKQADNTVPSSRPGGGSNSVECTPKVPKPPLSRAADPSEQRPRQRNATRRRRARRAIGTTPCRRACQPETTPRRFHQHLGRQVTGRARST